MDLRELKRVEGESARRAHSSTKDIPAKMLKSERKILEHLNYSGRTFVHGLWGGNQAWGNLAWEGQQEDWGVLPDGRKIEKVLKNGDIGELPPCWIQIENTGTYGDMMWNSAMMFSFVSDRFVEVLESKAFGGYQLLPLEVQPKRRERFGGYSLLVPDNKDSDAPIRTHAFFNRMTATLDLSVEVMSALTDAGVTKFRTKDAEKSIAEMHALGL